METTRIFPKIQLLDDHRRSEGSRPLGSEAPSLGGPPSPTAMRLQTRAELKLVTRDVGTRQVPKQVAVAAIEGARAMASPTPLQRNGKRPQSDTHAVKRLRGAIDGLETTITSRAAEIEAGRRIPPDLVDELRSMGVFRLLAPRRHGGFELDLPAALEILVALARIDGSVGWTVAIANGGHLFTPLLPRDTYEEVYRTGAAVIVGGWAQPAGTAEAASGGWRVSGRWPFASGCQHADWMLGLCIMSDGGQPFPGEGEVPLVRGFFLPACEWRIDDTWHVSGLKGTGSHHIALDDALNRKSVV